MSQLDYSDEAISRLSDTIDERIAPFADARDRLCTIPGVDRRIAEAIIGEIGVDMTKFATPGHLASWAGMCPGQHESAGKSKKGDRPQGRQLAPAPPGCGRYGGGAHQRHLPGLPIPPPGSSTGRRCAPARP